MTNASAPDPAPETEPPPWKRGDRVLLAALCALAFGSLLFFVHPWYDRTNDGSVYLLTARSLAAGEGYAYLGEPFRLRPPGLSVLLVPFVRAEEIDFFAVNLVVGLFGAATVVLLFVYQRPHLGAALAFLAAVALWAQPGFQRLSTQVMSDVPGAALLLACLLVERWSARAPHPAREVLLGAVIGASGYVRSALLLLVPAVAASRLLTRGRLAPRERRWRSFAPRRIALFAATAALVVLPWSIRNRAAAPEPPADQTWQYSTSTYLWRVQPSRPDSPRVSPGAVAARIPERAREALDALATLRLTKPLPQSEESGGAIGTVGAVALLAGLLAVLAKRRDPAEFFVFASLLALSVFPSPFLDRYTLPVLLFALPATATVLRGVFHRLAGPRVARFATGALLLVLAALAFEPRKDWGQIETRHERLASRSAAIAGGLAPDARVAAPTGWHLSLFLGRPVWSLVYAVQIWGLEKGVEKVIDRYGIDTIVAADGESLGGAVLSYCVERYPGRVRLLRAEGGWSGAIVRVR